MFTAHRSRHRLRTALAGIAGALALASAAPAAEAKSLVAQRDFTVHESDLDVNTSLNVQPGDQVVFSADGTIWSGWWFFGRNGPEGLNFNAESRDYPAPGRRSDSLLGKLNGRYFPVGAGRALTHYDAASTLWLRINDNWAGNGNGAFNVHVEVYR